MSCYVQRTSPAGRPGWTGPIRSSRQAQREAAAWQSIGWTAEVVVSTPEVKAAVRAWERDVKQRRERQKE